MVHCNMQSESLDDSSSHLNFTNHSNDYMGGLWLYKPQTTVTSPSGSDALMTYMLICPYFSKVNTALVPSIHCYCIMKCIRTFRISFCSSGWGIHFCQLNLLSSHLQKLKRRSCKVCLCEITSAVNAIITQ